MTDIRLRPWHPSDTTRCQGDVCVTNPETGAKELKVTAGTSIPLLKLSDKGGLYASKSEADASLSSLGRLGLWFLQLHERA